MRLLRTTGAAAVAVCMCGAATAAHDDTALAVYGGVMADEDWQKVVTGKDVDFLDTGLAAVALSRRVGRIGEDLDIELEGQVVRHFGDQEHWEVNGLVTGRWTRFPWNDTVATTAAFGLGLSHATEVPAEERRVEGASRRTLLYWMAEIETGAPDSPWSGFVRLHHRSTGYGLFGDDGGGNWVTLGIRRRF